MRAVNYVLTDAKLRAASAAAKRAKEAGNPLPIRKLADGGGLFVRVAASGTVSWAYAYTYGAKEAKEADTEAEATSPEEGDKKKTPPRGKSKEIGLGTWPEVGVKAARDRHFAARQALADDRDPAAEKREAKLLKNNPENNFKAISEKWYKARQAKWSVKYAARIKNHLDSDIYPLLGDKPIASIKSEHILACVNKKVESSPHCAERIRGTLSAIFKKAIAQQLYPHANPALSVREAIEIPQGTPHRHIGEKQLGEFWNALTALEETHDPSTINAARFLAYTLCRKSEVLLATWDEIEWVNENEANFVIAAERMKMRKPHVVPLSSQAVAILKNQKETCGEGKYIFRVYGKKTPLENSTVNGAFLRIGLPGERKFTPHGLRGTGATILLERGFSADVVDKLLAHSVRGVRKHYFHHELVEERKACLATWANLIGQFAETNRAMKSGANVIELQAA